MNGKISKIAQSAVFAAMIFVLTAFVHIPAPSGYIHFGDAILYIAAIFMGAPWAFVAGAIGEGLADVAGGFAAYAPATVIIKILMALPFIFVRGEGKKLFTLKASLMTIPAALINVGGYFLADLIISRAYAFVDIPGNIVQSVASAIIFIILAAALDKAKIIDKISKK